MMVSKVCSICGTPFESNRVNAKYCSDRCRKKGKYLSGRVMTVCECCGKRFYAWSQVARFCSPKCSGTAQYKSVTEAVDMRKYHSESLDRKIREWDNYGKQQGYRTLLDVGKVDVDGIMSQLKGK